MSHLEPNGTVLKFPDQFLWGTGTSTTQIEGHIDNEWTNFTARDGSHCRIACDSYHRYVEDIEWMGQLGVNAYRVGIEWSRLQTEPGGELHEGELARYIDQLDRLRAAGITPMVVLHHFSNPPWINAIGAWTNADTIPAFVEYAEKLVAALRGHVRMWNTFNEPDTYACCGYLIAEFPPLKKGRVDDFRAVVKNMAAAHLQVCRIIREADSPLGKVEVGFSKNWTFFEPYVATARLSKMIARISHYLMNHFVAQCFLGDGRHKESTFLGLNYYGRIRFKNFQALVPTAGMAREELIKMGIECDDMLERYPAGLEQALMELHRLTHLPIYITEHGSSSSDETFRERDLKENLAALHRAIGRGVDVRGFYYWSLLDNFEWQFGYAKKFGLLEVDFNSEQRTRKMKPLGLIYRKVCLENSLAS
jgi:beta-glucosidase